MDYKDFFGFQDDPFRLTPDTQYFFPSVSHQSALEALKFFFASREGFALIVGEAGTGKTLLLRMILKDLPPDKEIALILTPNLDPTELLRAIVRDLGIESDPPRDKDQLIKLFSQYLLSKVQEGKGVVIVIDEAQNLPIESLEQLRLLSNLETEKEKLLQILLVGQPELLDKIKDKRLRQLDQRITIKEKLLPLSEKETEEYIFFRLSKAGKGNLQVDRKAIKEIHKLSGGIPRKINAIFSRALLLAYADSTYKLTKNIIKKAYESISLEEKTTRRTPLLSRVLISIGVLLVLAALISFAFHEKFAFLLKTQAPSSSSISNPAKSPPPQPTNSPAPPTKTAPSHQASPNPAFSGQHKTEDLAQIPPTPQKPDPKALYQKGLEYVRTGQLEPGRKILREFFSLYPHHPLADNALYWLGESYFFQGNLEKAREYFTKTIKLYPQGNKAPYAIFKRALSFLKEGNKERAMEDLQRLLKEYPQSEIATMAREELQALKNTQPGKGG